MPGTLVNLSLPGLLLAVAAFEQPLSKPINSLRLTKELIVIALVLFFVGHLAVRVGASVRAWWIRTAGFRLRAFGDRLLALWCGWMHPDRCVLYAAVAFFGMTVYPQWSQALVPFLFYAVNATFGRYLMQTAPQRIRQLWLIFTPLILILIVCAQFFGYIANWQYTAGAPG